MHRRWCPLRPSPTGSPARITQPTVHDRAVRRVVAAWRLKVVRYGRERPGFETWDWGQRGPADYLGYPPPPSDGGAG